MKWTVNLESSKREEEQHSEVAIASEVHEFMAASLRWSPDGALLAACYRGREHVARFWDLLLCHCCMHQPRKQRYMCSFVLPCKVTKKTPKEYYRHQDWGGDDVPFGKRCFCVSDNRHLCHPCRLPGWTPLVCVRQRVYVNRHLCYFRQDLFFQQRTKDCFSKTLVHNPDKTIAIQHLFFADISSWKLAKEWH